MNKIKVLYIAGMGRSGSTLLEQVLGQIDGFFAAGEIFYLWDRGMLHNHLCGCGSPFSDCLLWESIMNNFKEKQSNNVVNIERINQIKQQKIRYRNIIKYFSKKKNYDKDLEEYLNMLSILYHSIADTTESQIIVDSSKHPMYLWLLSKIPILDLHVIHLVRDSRAVAHSWVNPKASIDPNAPAEMDKISLFTTSLLWCIDNLLLMYFGYFQNTKYMLIRYEDFSVKPINILHQILSLTEEKNKDLSFIDQNVVVLKNNIHTIAGNPIRFNKEIVKIQSDIRWIDKMSLGDKIKVSIITFPFLFFYGYRIM